MEEKNNETITKVLAWIPRYRPFIMGGDVHAGIKAELQVVDTLDVGQGHKVHVVKAPNGVSFYVETECGAMMGNDLMMILEDVKQGDPEVMKGQIEQGRKDRDRAELSHDLVYFWSYMKGSGASRKAI